MWTQRPNTILRSKFILWYGPVWSGILNEVDCYTGYGLQKLLSSRDFAGETPEHVTTDESRFHRLMKPSLVGKIPLQEPDHSFLQELVEARSFTRGSKCSK